MTLEVTIDSLGAKGDGVAFASGAPLFVPFALPGERVTVDREGARAALVSVLDASNERQDAPCPHFGRCGGCDLQHAAPPLYADFKRNLVTDAFASRGIEAEVGELIPCEPASRRRAVFSGARTGNRITFGFFEQQTNHVAEIDVCLVVVPEIAARLADFKGLALIVADKKRPMRMAVTATATGLDIALSETAKLTEGMRQSILAFSLRRDFARVSLEGEVIVETRKPTIRISDIAVSPSAGGFLQAVASAEAAMAGLVAEHLAPAKATMDLFSGIGTFALRLAAKSSVHAVETEADALAALDLAKRGAQGLKPITMERRDLFRRPVTARELNKVDGLVFDPPRAGAEMQAREIAASTVKRVAAVSCNPATLARDARILLDGGYRLVTVTPIDQFLWSHHVEVVALFER
ncbi:MAG: class I SAM-dependent RNA methyltransferase [Rhizobiaceae bacterium]|nr:class I SAM-dependent RNA methyltransferase [Rhizobiaceae bacterium]